MCCYYRLSVCGRDFLFLCVCAIKGSKSVLVLILRFVESSERVVMDSIFALAALCCLFGVFIFGLPMLLVGAGSQATLPLVFGGIGGLIWLCGVLFYKD